MQVENVTGVGLTTRGTTEQQRHLTISDGLLGQIVVNDQGVTAIVPEPFSDRGLDLLVYLIVSYCILLYMFVYVCIFDARGTHRGERGNILQL